MKPPRYDWKKELWRAIKKNPPAAAMELICLLAALFFVAFLVLLRKVGWGG